MAPVTTATYLVTLLLLGPFVEPVDIDRDLSDNIYVVDAGRDLLIKYSPEGDSIAAVGGFGTGTESFDRPKSVWARTGTDVLVADYNNHRIQRFDRRLDYVNTLHTRDSQNEQAQFGYPKDAALSRQGETYVLDSENGRIVAFDASNNFIRSFGDVASGKGRLEEPSMIELDARDNVYVLEPDRVAVFDPFGSWLNSLPLEGNLNVVGISVAGDTLSLISQKGLVRIRMSEKGRMMERVSVVEFSENSSISGGRVADGRVATIDSNRVRVRNLPGQASDTLQGR